MASGRRPPFWRSTDYPEIGEIAPRECAEVRSREDERGERRLGMALRGLILKGGGPRAAQRSPQGGAEQLGRIKPGAMPVVQHGLRVWRANADGRAVAAVKA
jgi:hypothetical protein